MNQILSVISHYNGLGMCVLHTPGISIKRGFVTLHSNMNNSTTGNMEKN